MRQQVYDVLDKEGGPVDRDGGRMWPIHIRPDSGKLHGSQISWGAMGDSYYEYLLKLWLFTGTPAGCKRRRPSLTAAPDSPPPWRLWRLEAGLQQPQAAAQQLGRQRSRMEGDKGGRSK